ncbi:calcium-dependent lipid-binding family protein [Tanacetum coccineum]|uniref:Calcium-dependent lipid-binding family protein n=1 Tax=Tanacetum coccineum TaxID=301880 RepID=A0ABQ4ZYU1_9ASTR
MESCKLEIVIHSGKGLTDVKNFGTMDPYVRVWLAGENEQSPVYRTETAIKGQVQVRVSDLLAGDDSGENISYPVKTSSGEIGGEIILSHTISVGENVVDMKSIETEKEGQFAMDVIKEVAIGVAIEAGIIAFDVAKEAVLIVFS